MKHRKAISVVVIPSWYPPLGGDFFREHSIALANMGMRIAVMAQNETGIRNNPAEYLMTKPGTAEIKSNGIREITSNIRRIPLLNRKNAIRWTKRLLSVYAQYTKVHGHPDIIQAHSSMWGGLAAAWIKEKYGIPYVITEHRGRFTGKDPRATRLIRNWHVPLLQTAFGKANHIVTVSKPVQHGILQISPQSGTKMSVIPNMTDTRFFCPANTISPDKQTWEKPHPFTFICVSHLERNKGVDRLLQAFAILKEKIKHIRLIIGGDGPEKRKLKRLCSDLALNDVVFFAGHMERRTLLHKLQTSHAFVLSSVFESFGVVLIEAMACGLPLISTRSGGPEEIINNDNGLLTAGNEPTMLASAMEAMISGYAGYDRQVIRQIAEEKYSQHVIAKQYIALYSTIIDDLDARQDVDFEERSNK